ncbi:hypothetical protein WME94_50635 [Sorangium sp. So ce429]
MIEVIPQGDSARLRVIDANARTGLDLEIIVTPAGPIVRVRAQAVELDAVDAVAVHCEQFKVEARGAIALRAGGAATLEASAVNVEARVGGAVIRANDDVQLLGEQILLNCDRQPPIPRWVQSGPPPQLVPVAATSGDASLLSALERDEE